MFRRFVCIIFLLLVNCIAQASADAQEKGALGSDEPPMGGDFTLYSDKGPVSTKSLRGKVIMLYFGYTKCPDVCPTSLSLMTQALNELSEDELRKVVSLFVSVDPNRDKVDMLAEYVSYFHSNYLGLTGTEEQVAEVAKRYGVQFHQVELKDSAFGYSVNHSSATYFIDQAGELRFVFPHNTPSSILLEGIRYLLAEE